MALPLDIFHHVFSYSDVISRARCRMVSRDIGYIAERSLALDRCLGSWLETAITNNHPQSVRFLLSIGGYRRNLLPLACRCGYGEIVEILLSRVDVNPMIDGNLPLVEAVSHGHRDVVRILLDHRWLSSSGEIMRVNPIIGYPPDPRYLHSPHRAPGNFNQALRIAILSGHVEIVAMILDSTPRDEIVDDSGSYRRLLWLAHDDNIRSLLLSRG